MRKIIELTISPDGQVQLQTKGFGGPSCKEASGFLEKALGQISMEQVTAEFHADRTQLNRVSQS